ncbi:MAG: adenine deaminase, partial [Dehalococcoidia bacterium]|nr:adenine deaminase [Dehalococcoidia bacterium]
GIILAADGKIIHEVPLLIGGFLSELPMEIVANQLNELRRKLGELGCTLPDPHLSLTLLTTAAIPHLRLSEYGLVNLRDGKSVALVVE